MLELTVLWGKWGVFIVGSEVEFGNGWADCWHPILPILCVKEMFGRGEINTKKVFFEKAINYDGSFQKWFNIVRKITYCWVKGWLWHQLSRLLTPNTFNHLCERHVLKGWTNISGYFQSVLILSEKKLIVGYVRGFHGQGLGRLLTPNNTNHSCERHGLYNWCMPWSEINGCKISG